MCGRVVQVSHPIRLSIVHGLGVRETRLTDYPRRWNAAPSLVSTIHDRMPAILAPAAYDRWLGAEPDPRDLLQPFPSELLAMWPISTRVNSPWNGDEHLLDEIEFSKERPAGAG